MKNLLIAIIGVVIFSACQQSKNESTSEVSHEVSTEEIKPSTLQYYGDKITTENAINTDELLAALENNDSVNVKFSSEIEATCKMKGCWMDVALPNGESMKVTFKDYGFFVPKEGVEGKTTIVEGYAKTVETDVETLKHYAKDAGKSEEEIAAITEPKQEVVFVASGVIIEE